MAVRRGRSTAGSRGSGLGSAWGTPHDRTGTRSGKMGTPCSRGSYCTTPSPPSPQAWPLGPPRTSKAPLGRGAAAPVGSLCGSGGGGDREVVS